MKKKIIAFMLKIFITINISNFIYKEIQKEVEKMNIVLHTMKNYES
jgi:uncharacterized protein YxeA